MRARLEARVIVKGEPHVSVMEAARLLGVHWMVVYRGVWDKRFDAVRRFGSWYVKESSLQEYIKSADAWLVRKGRQLPQREMSMSA